MNRDNQFNKAFTLVELLVVMAILGVLVTLIGTGFRSAQTRGRDVQRKSDLKTISNALELFYSDYGQYPESDSARISACPFEKGVGGVPCTWGVGQFTDNRTIYLKKVPQDPSSNYNYYYRVVIGSNNKKFQLFAHLENTQDQDCLPGGCSNPPVSYSCGDKVCNFAITSSNSDALE